MKPKIYYLYLLTTVLISTIKAGEIIYVDMLENLHPFKLLKGLEENLNESRCLDDVEEYSNGISSNKPWALKMFDSSSKIGEGVLLRSNYFLGQFDECVAVKHPENIFDGQYCLQSVYLNLENFTTVSKRYSEITGETSSKFELTFGMCLPSTCTPSHVHAALEEIFPTGSNNTTLISTAYKPDCHSKTFSPGLTAEAWVATTFFMFIAAVALASTCYDVYQRIVLNNRKPKIWFTFFSLYANGRQLFGISKTHDQLQMLNGIRVFSTCWVILHNGYLRLLYMSPVADRVGTVERYMDNAHIITLNGNIAVDSFFLLSGLLVCYSFFETMAKKGSYDVPLAYINRYIRITPPYAILILFSVTIFPYLGSGPIWHFNKFFLSEQCAETWWYGLLFINNFFSPFPKCLGSTWYLSADMQLHWTSPLILYPLYMWQYLAPILLAIVISAAALTTFTIAYVNDLGPHADVTPNPNQLAIDYFPFYTRAAPWLIGVALGYAICTIRARKINIRLSKFLVIIGWLTSTGLCLGSLYGLLRFTNHQYSKLEAAFYLTFHRVGWGVGLAWIVFACTYGYGGPVNNFLSWSLFEPLGKLTYSAYLVHEPIQLYRSLVLRVTANGNDNEATYSFLGDVTLSFLIAIPLTLIFEMPFRNMYKYFFQNVEILPFPKKKKQADKEKSEEIHDSVTLQVEKNRKQTKSFSDFALL